MTASRSPSSPRDEPSRRRADDLSVLCLAILSLGGLPPPGDCAAASLPTPPPVIAVGGSAKGDGELALCDSTGTVLRRYVGLAGPTHLAPGADGRILVTDERACSILEVDLEGNVDWTWHCPDTGPRPWAATLLPSGNVLFAANREGAAEVDRTGRIVWQVPSPIPGNPVRSAIRLADASTILVVVHPQKTLFRVGPGSAGATFLPVGLEDDQRNLPGGAALTSGLDRFLMWDADWPAAYVMRWTGDGVRVEGRVPLPRLADAVPDASGGYAFTLNDEFEAGYLDRAGRRVTFNLNYQPTGILRVGGDDRFLVSYSRLPDASWPESWGAATPAATISWARFSVWVLAALGLGGVLNASMWRRGRTRPITGAGPREGEVPGGPFPLPLLPAKTRTTVLAGALFVGGVAGAVRGELLLLRGDGHGWLAWLLGGAVVAAAVAETWRRRVLKSGDGFWRAAIAARPDLSAAPVLAAGAVAVVTGSALLFLWRWRRLGSYTDQVGLWVFLLLTLVAMSMLSTTPPWHRRLRLNWRETAAVALPLAVAAVTLFYRLSVVPAYIHFDFVFNATSALELMKGRWNSIWQNGFVPAPVIGLVPEVVGLWLVGPGELGFRLGGALFGLSGIVAVYLLGRAYRDRRTGVLAALLLAGSVPFIHFSRLNANGDAATAGLWAMTLFALAVRNGRLGTWILAGLASGYCFYLWPGARVAVVALFVSGCLFAVRSPRLAIRRAPCVLLMAVAAAVWLVPLVPLWLHDPILAFPRVRESLEVFKPGEGIQWSRLIASFGKPLLDSLGWFFVSPDNSSQGTLSPGCNPVEAALLSVGLLIAVTEGFSVNVLLLVQIGLVLLTLGAWGGTPPWYTRMLPSIPAAALLMARAATGGLDLLSGTHARLRRAATALVLVLVLGLSPLFNLWRYVGYETGRWGRCRFGEMVAIGRRLRDLGPRYHDYLVITKRSDWTVDWHRRNGRLGELLPFIWRLHVSEIRDLPSRLPLPRGEPAAVVIQADRIHTDVGLLKLFYPDAKFEELRDPFGAILAGLVLVERP